jgi:hypothetical protein
MDGANVPVCVVRVRVRAWVWVWSVSASVRGWMCASVRVVALQFKERCLVESINQCRGATWLDECSVLCCTLGARFAWFDALLFALLHSALLVG